MILLFGDKAAKSTSTKKNSNINSHPVENSGILAMSLSDAKSLLTMGEFDTFISSNPVAINYALYADTDFSSDGSGFLSSYSAALSFLGSEGGFSDGGCSSFAGSCSGFSGGSSGGSFASVC